MKKVSLIVAAVAVLAMFGGVALADDLWYPYFLADEGAAWFSTDIWVSNVSGTDVVFNVNLYTYAGTDLVTNPATVVTVAPGTTVPLNINGLIDTTAYAGYLGGFVKACIEFEEVSNFTALSTANWGAITAMQTGAGYIFFATWL